MREPDLSKLAKTLTSKRLECTEEIKMLMDCMMVRRRQRHTAAAQAAAATASHLALTLLLHALRRAVCSGKG